MPIAVPEGEDPGSPFGAFAFHVHFSPRDGASSTPMDGIDTAISGGFSEVTGSPFDLGHSAWYVAVADLNEDSNADVLAAAGNGVRVMLGDGSGGFRPAPGSPFPGKGAWQLAVGDVNGDDKPDVVASNLESNTVSIWLAQ